MKIHNKMNKAMLLIYILLTLIGCENYYDNYNTIPGPRIGNNDTIDLKYGVCLSDWELNQIICFDSVITDSRCPEDVVCVWAGEAVARFNIRRGQMQSISLDLYLGTTDTTVGDYRISFVELLPYPNTKVERIPADYIARIVVKRK
jgi:hypothetical protein